MTEFTDLMASLAKDSLAKDSLAANPADGNDAPWRVSVSDDWLQGRTAYGGLSAALCLEAALREFPDLPLLRSAQIAFIGPASGDLTMRATLLRRGKSASFVGVDLAGEAGLATRAIFVFGGKRESAMNHADVAMPKVLSQAESPTFFRSVPGLNFVQHFEGGLAAGGLPFSGGDPMLTLWLRHRDPAKPQSLVALLALADAPPPAAIVIFKKFTPLSTMTWMIDMLTDDVSTDDGWFLVRTAAETCADGYSGQAMTIWNATGRPVLAARQTIAVFG